MRFLILTTYGIRETEAEDFETAADDAYDTHTGYKNVLAIVKAEEGE